MASFFSFLKKLIPINNFVNLPFSEKSLFNIMWGKKHILCFLEYVCHTSLFFIVINFRHFTGSIPKPRRKISKTEYGPISALHLHRSITTATLLMSVEWAAYEKPWPYDASSIYTNRQNFSKYFTIVTRKFSVSSILAFFQKVLWNFFRSQNLKKKYIPKNYPELEI